MESRREIHWTYGPVTSSIYRLKELDSYGDTSSVLDVIVRSEADNVRVDPSVWMTYFLLVIFANTTMFLLVSSAQFQDHENE